MQVKKKKKQQLVKCPAVYSYRRHKSCCRNTDIGGRKDFSRMRSEKCTKGITTEAHFPSINLVLSTVFVIPV
jgi:hypothetical protein